MQFVNHSGSTQRARETNTLQLALNWDPRFRGFAQSVGQNHKKKLVCLMLLWFVVSFHPKMTTILCRKSLTLCGYPLICWMRHVSFKRCGAHTFYMDGSSSELQDSKHSKHEPKHHSDAIAKLAKLMQLLSLLVGLSQIHSFPGTIWLATAARRAAGHTQWGQVMVNGTDGKLRDFEHGLKVMQTWFAQFEATLSSWGLFKAGGCYISIIAQ